MSKAEWNLTCFSFCCKTLWDCQGENKYLLLLVMKNYVWLSNTWWADVLSKSPLLYIRPVTESINREKIRENKLHPWFCSITLIRNAKVWVLDVTMILSVWMTGQHIFKWAMHLENNCPSSPITTYRGYLNNESLLDVQTQKFNGGYLALELLGLPD